MQGKTGIIFTFSGIVDKFMEKRYQKSSVPCGGGQPEQQKINTVSLEKEWSRVKAEPLFTDRRRLF
jgi:hypothetical protein